MEKVTAAEKSDPAFDNSAFALKEEQHAQAVSLHQSQMKTAHGLKAYHGKIAKNLLNSAEDYTETPEQSRQYAASNLAGAQIKAAAMLKDSQSRAAKALNSSQMRAAAALRSSHIKAQEIHDEKNEVISWLGGSYSVSGKHDK